MRAIFLVSFFLISLCGMNIFAAPSHSSANAARVSQQEEIKQNNLFDAAKANQMLDEISAEVSLENSSIESLDNITEQFIKLQGEAKTCIKTADESLSKLNEEKSIDQKNVGTATDLQSYLNQKQNDLTQWRSECQLFVLRSGETINLFNAAIKKLSAKKLFELEPHFFTKLTLNQQYFKDLSYYLDKELLWNESGLNLLFQPAPLISLILLEILGMLASFFIRRACLRYLKEAVVENAWGHFKLTLIHLCRSMVSAFLRAIPFLLITSVLAIIHQEINYLLILAFLWLGELLIATLIKFFLHPYYGLKSMSRLPPEAAQSLYHRIRWFLWFCVFSSVVFMVLQHQVIPLAITDLLKTIGITLLCLLLISILWQFYRLPFLWRRHFGWRLLFTHFFSLGFFAIIIIHGVGYQELSLYLLQGLTATLGFGLLAWFMTQFFGYFFRSVIHEEYWLQKKIRSIFGFHLNHPTTELLFIALLVYLFIWGGFLLELFNAWGLSDATMRMISGWLTGGFKLGMVNIVPLRILWGSIAFTGLLLFTRWMKTQIERVGTKNHLSQGVYKAASGIVNYIGVGMALLMGLLLAGVNFSGLAIIAGALSVGIGFGLQNIVNNFVSGIILLIERPIKPGDRILVGDIEGYVEKISIRATQIRTLICSDLIVPNSELISKQVTNLMLHDFHYRLIINVSVAYDSDIVLVKQLLLEAANEHPEVIKNDPSNQPSVLLNEFGDSALKFILSCVIQNVSLRYGVNSDLHFSIYEKFKAHGIVIPFPQQDVHLLGPHNPRTTAASPCESLCR